MAKLRKVVFFDDSLGFLKDLTRGGRLVNVIMKQVFTGGRTANLELAMDLIHGRKKLDVNIVDSSGRADNKREGNTAGTPSRIQVNIRKDQARTGNEKERVKTKGKEEKGAKKGLLDDLSRMAREFGD